MARDLKASSTLGQDLDRQYIDGVLTASVTRKNVVLQDPQIDVAILTIKIFNIKIDLVGNILIVKISLFSLRIFKLSLF